MGKTTILLGAVLIVLGLGAYGYAMTTENASMTAMIPAFFGVPILLLGVLATKVPAKRALFMHIAVLLALLGLIGAGRGLVSLPKLITSPDDVARPVAVIVQSVMAVLCLVYVVMAVRSFVAARKAAPILLLPLLLLGGCETNLVVATDAVFPPFHSVDETGRLVGFDIDLAREAVTRIGEPVRFVRADSYSRLYVGLRDREYDVIAATTGITPERHERHLFTRPYFETCLGVIVLKGSDGPRSPADLTRRRIAAAEGTTSARAAHAIPFAVVTETTRVAESLARLRAGNVDAIIIDEFEAVPFARESDDLEVLPEPVAVERYGLVLRRTDLKLRDRLNAALDEMEADGTLGELRAKFGLERPDDWPIRRNNHHARASAVNAAVRSTHAP